jgi:hypothetical protein
MSSDIFSDRLTRTVEVSVDPGHEPVDRYSFGLQLESTVGIRALEAVGPTSNRNLFQLTFNTVEAAKTFLDAGDFTVKNRTAKVSMVTKTKFRIRVDWVPHFVPMSVIVNSLERSGELKVQHAHNEKSRVKGFEHVFTLVRYFTVTADFVEDIPNFISWSFDDMVGRALVTAEDKPPVCLRCHKAGHVRKNCDEPYCNLCRSFGHPRDECTKESWTRVKTVEPTPSSGAVESS